MQVKTNIDNQLLMKKIPNNTKNTKRIALWSCWIGNKLLLITPKPECNVFDFHSGKQLIKETYHNETFYRYPSTTKRIKQSVIKKLSVNSNIIF